MKKTLAGWACVGAMLVLAWGTNRPSGEAGRPDLEDGPEVPEGVEVLTHGPVHEAFVSPGIADPEPSPVIPKAPPEPVPELPPELKPEGDNVTWISGYWAWDTEGEEYLWVSGTWRDVPPDRQWMPGYWHEVEGGNQWIAGYWAVQGETEVEIVPPPPEPIAEAIPPPPDAESTFIPGTWVFVENRFWWRPGFFVRYRPGWTWVSACYRWTPAGCVFVDGFWDHDIHHCGLLFAPVRFVDVEVLRRPGFYFRPHHAVQPDFLLGSLFVRRGGSHRYYFGDYYDPRYARSGFTAWVDFRVGGRHYDPLFSYYRWHYRDRPRWETEIRTVYEARREGTLARPPRTFKEQEKLSETSKESLRVAVPLSKFREVEKATGKTTVKLTSVTKTEITQVTKRIEEYRVLRESRGKVEAKVRASGGAKAAAVKVELLRPKVEARAPKADRAPPPPPTVSKTLSKGFEGKVGDPKDKDLPKKDLGKDAGKDKLPEPFKDKDKFKDPPKLKDKDFPKKDFGKDKDLDPIKDKDFPKLKDKDFPKKDFGKDVDPFKDKDIPKFKDKAFDPFKDKDKFKDPPKLKDKDLPKLKDLGKDKDIDPFKDKDLPKLKDKDFPKLKDFDIPKGKDGFPPKPPKEFDRPKGKGKDDVSIDPPRPPVSVRPAPPQLPIPNLDLPDRQPPPRIVPPLPRDPAVPVPLSPLKKGKGREKY